MLGKSIILLFTAFLIGNTKCARILLLFNFPSKSMHLAAVSMAEILAEKGHNVTMVTSYKLSKPTTQFKHIFLHEVADVFEDDTMNYYEYNEHPYKQVYGFNLMGFLSSEKMFQNSEFQQLLKSHQKFDLAIMEIVFTESLLYVAQYLNVPLILYTSVDASAWSNYLVGNPTNPSCAADVLLPYSNEMTFFQRLDNTLMHTVNQLYQHFFTLPNHDRITKNIFQEHQIFQSITKTHR
ncbi:hypothetical protein HHI36_006736 [Cryptolaemus montrouzieri]|uniref:UDP-glucuronosyltransferase n=1 Tax=Cryptolaemus montrouzieri TaxID=559131 RepID=A0ABD2NYG2_9CUCU